MNSIRYRNGDTEIMIGEKITSNCLVLRVIIIVW